MYTSTSLSPGRLPKSGFLTCTCGLPHAWLRHRPQHTRLMNQPCRLATLQACVGLRLQSAGLSPPDSIGSRESDIIASFASTEKMFQSCDALTMRVASCDAGLSMSFRRARQERDASHVHGSQHRQIAILVPSDQSRSRCSAATIWVRVSDGLVASKEPGARRSKHTTGPRLRGDSPPPVRRALSRLLSVSTVLPSLGDSA